MTKRRKLPMTPPSKPPQKAPTRNKRVGNVHTSVCLPQGMCYGRLPFGNAAKSTISLWKGSNWPSESEAVSGTNVHRCERMRRQETSRHRSIQFFAVNAVPIQRDPKQTLK
jgi:hypothetical protein